MMDMGYAAAVHRLRAAALNSITAHDYPNLRDPHHEAASMLADEQLAFAARALVDSINVLHPSEQPVGWACGAAQELPARQPDGEVDLIDLAGLANDHERLSAWLAAHGMGGQFAPPVPDVLLAVAADLPAGRMPGAVSTEAVPA